MFIQLDDNGKIIGKASMEIPGFLEYNDECNIGDYYIEGVIDTDKRKWSEKREEIRNAFDNECISGHFFSQSLQIEVDCRRNDKKNDKQNVEGLISTMTRKGITTCDYVGYTETKSGVTIPQLQALVYEMEDTAIIRFEKKRALLKQIELTDDLKELKKILW